MGGCLHGLTHLGAGDGAQKLDIQGFVLLLHIEAKCKKTPAHVSMHMLIYLDRVGRLQESSLKQLPSSASLFGQNRGITPKPDYYKSDSLFLVHVA